MWHSAPTRRGESSRWVLDASGIDEPAMSAAAADVGYSETAFVVPLDEGSLGVRYFSPLVEVPFCGHATIATAVAYARRHGVGNLLFHTKAGPVAVHQHRGGRVRGGHAGERAAPVGADLGRRPGRAARRTALAAEDLDPALPPRAAYAGAWHPVVAAASRARLADLDYDMLALADLMPRRDWATVDLVWRESSTVYHARNPFPPGGAVEDPATGAAAAAFGGYLREMGLVPTPTTVTIHQGHDMGRPSTITVTIRKEPDSGIAVTGTAIRILPARGQLAISTTTSSGAPNGRSATPTELRACGPCRCPKLCTPHATC